MYREIGCLTVLMWVVSDRGTTHETVVCCVLSADVVASGIVQHEVVLYSPLTPPRIAQTSDAPESVNSETVRQLL